jgi:protein involved in polysaccharide export with SLBB domain
MPLRAQTALFLLLLALAVPAGAQTPSTGAGYGIKPGDQIVTDFFTAGGERLQSVQGERIVDRDGNVYFPYVGTVHVEGLDAGGIRDLLIRKFQPFYNDPVITVNVQLRVNVTGVVPAPGHYLLDPTSTIVDALATAGGAGGEIAINNNVAGDPSEVRLIRTDGETMLLDLRPDNADPDVLGMLIQSGDWIHVPPLGRSRWRDDIQFWGSVLTLLTSVVILGDYAID